jgi:uncharacterized lipoprotein YddW (UPF0748 family)
LPTPALNLDDLRGVWVHPRSILSPQAVDQVIAQAGKANINTLIVGVYLDAVAYYNSQVVKPAGELPDKFDPLAYLTSQAHQHGLQVHAWFVVGWATRLPTKPGPILSEHPDWAMVDACGTPGRWLNPAKPEVRQFIVNLVTEVAQNYPVDGLHLDYIRYPGPEWSFDTTSAETFRQTYGVDFEAIRQPQLPAWGYFSGNPLTSPTTAQVLATFDNGIPALLLNRYGQGEVILFNWNISVGCQVGAIHEMMKRSLERLTSDGNQVYLLRAEGITQERFVAPIELWLRRLERQPTDIDTVGVAELSPGDVLVLPNAYIIPPELAQTLAKFVAAGGKLIFIDGPTPSYADPNLQLITGMSSRGRHFNQHGMWLNPNSKHPLLPIGTPTWNETLVWQWAEFRQQNITSLIKAIHQAVTAVNPQLTLSAAVFPSLSEAEKVAQNWPAWLENGDLDFAAPMAYVDNVAELPTLTAEWQNNPNFKRIVPGLIVFNESNESELKSPQEVLNEIEFMRAQGLKGAVLFDMYHLSEELLKELARRPFAPEN